MKLLPYKKETYPTHPGVYRMINANNTIMYIGKAKNLKNRLGSYFDSSKRSPRIDLMIKEIKEIEITITATENDALVLEQKLINKIKPKYNIIFRDDKSYPFIALSKHKFPKVYITREKNKDTKQENLFGPYPNRDDAYRNVEFVQNIFKLRTCKDTDFAHRSRPCVLHSIGKCSAPCVQQQSTAFSNFYNEQVGYVKKMLNGNVKPTIEILKQRMEEYSVELKFEEAAKLRDSIDSLKDLSRKQTIYSLTEEDAMVFNFYQGKNVLYIGYTQIIDGTPQQIFHQAVRGELMQYSIEEVLTTYIENEVQQKGLSKIWVPIELKNLFYDYQFKSLSKQQKHWLQLVHSNLQLLAQEEDRKQHNKERTLIALEDVFIKPVHSIDCIDISHHGGEATYGGKIRWTHNGYKGELDKPYYRLSKFTDNIIDDIEHMKGTVAKIYHSDEDTPDLLIIDGGKDQLAAAVEGFKGKNTNKDTIIMSSAKGVSRKKGQETFFVHSDSLKLIHPQYIVEEKLELPKEHPLRLLIQHLQDSAHNFSNSAREKAMEKTRFG